MQNFITANRGLLLTPLFFITTSLFAQDAVFYKQNIIGDDLNHKIINNIQAAFSREIDKQQYLTSWQIKNIHAKSESLIQSAVQPYGYFNTVVNKEINKENNTYIGTYIVKLNEPMKINAATITGIDNIEEKTLTNIRSLIKLGDICNSKNYIENKEQIIYQLISIGYTLATINTSSMQANVAKNSCDIKIDIKTGQKFKLGKVKWDKTYLNHDFLNRYITFKPDSKYSRDNINNLRNNLINSGYFESLYFDIAPNHEKSILDINIRTIDILPRTTNFLIAYNTDNGINSEITYRIKPHNQYGHSIMTDIELSKNHKKLNINYIVPGTDPVNSNWGYDIEINDKIKQKTESLNEIHESKQEVSASHTKNNQDTLRRLSIGLLHEKKHDQQSENSYNVIPKIEIQRIIDKSLPTQTILRFTSLAAIKFTNSGTNLFQISADIEKNTLIRDNILIINARIADTIAPNNNNIPPSLLFYTGGVQDLRGYDYEEIGPGRANLQFNVELQSKIAKRWSSTFFIDNANVSDNLLMPLKTSIGSGFVWHSKMGQISLGIAKPLAKEKHNDGLKIYFNIHPSFQGQS